MQARKNIPNSHHNQSPLFCLTENAGLKCIRKKNFFTLYNMKKSKTHIR